MKNPSVSFCILTGGSRPEKLERLVRSIRGQEIPQYEIVIAGNPHSLEGVKTVPMIQEAAKGRLGMMRNGAASAAEGERLVCLDDDIILHRDWWKVISKVPHEVPLFTTRIILPDGTRFWDNAAGPGSPKGQRILNEGESDTHLYVSGGGGWVMSRSVFDRVKWRESDGFYTGGGEDVGFSTAARAEGYTPQYIPEAVAVHDDWKYTGFGRSVFVRKILDAERERLRVEIARNYPEKMINFAQSLWKNGSLGDALDVLRLCRVLHPTDEALNKIIQSIHLKTGGQLIGARWFWDGDPLYWEIHSWAEGVK